ncbi:Lateral flagellin [Enterovibrio norvegicus FF-33]|uniref:Flagellin n=1 Tax=Enterovibrio norvegicus FF-454 TaxID=1185651 RepID=A0A1E5BYQ9_9GAMM|nr:lateral flagellin LafA [Enterovibrio norvegicus]OEE58416.1 Lateral flagellin [Enterovibrio norvegicus FF-454]OEE70350.1 Lateral flagellin [Enterovibrio norvegicus FF-33]OEE77971.1 Lateral flagellin [Enterovibrio norvegicus FF-162]
MALSMHTNYASLVTQNTLNGTSNLLNTAMERLSTGYRINSAADDAAGLQISNRLEAQTRGMSVAMRNAQDGMSMLQTAEGAFDESTNILYRMNDLATQASNGTNTDADKDALQKEFSELGAELTNIMTNTKYAGDALITAAGIKTGGLTLQIGASSAETLDLATTVDTDVIAAHTALSATVPALDIGSAGDSGAAMDALATALDEVGAARAGLGATINRLDHTVVNLGNMSENTAAAKGRITDADFAVESSNMTKNQMLMQAGTTVLSQTNQLPGMAMSLLR